MKNQKLLQIPYNEVNLPLLGYYSTASSGIFVIAHPNCEIGPTFCPQDQVFNGDDVFIIYYKTTGRSFPDNAHCIRPAIPEGKAYPGAELILTPPATPEPVLIDDGMVSDLLNEYKFHFPKEAPAKGIK